MALGHDAERATGGGTDAHGIRGAVAGPAVAPEARRGDRAEVRAA